MDDNFISSVFMKTMINNTTITLYRPSINQQRPVQSPSLPMDIAPV